MANEQEKPDVAAAPKPRRRTQFKAGDPNNPAKHRERTGSGRQKGTRNRFTTVKNALIEAFDEVGGVDYLIKLARSRKDRGHFVTLLGKCIPTEVTGKDGGPIEVEVLNIAKVGLANLDDAEFTQFVGLLEKIGVGNPMALGAANDAQSTPLLPGPEESKAA